MMNKQAEIRGLEGLAAEAKEKNLVIIGDRHNLTEPKILALQLMQRVDFEYLFLEGFAQGTITSLSQLPSSALTRSRYERLVGEALSKKVRAYGVEPRKYESQEERVEKMANFMERKMGDGRAVVLMGRGHIVGVRDYLGNENPSILSFLHGSKERGRILTIVPHRVCDPSAAKHELLRKEAVDFVRLFPRLGGGVLEKSRGFWEEEFMSGHVDWLFLLPYDEEECRFEQQELMYMAKTGHRRTVSKGEAEQFKLLARKVP